HAPCETPARKPPLQAKPSPDPAIANDLFGFMMDRYVNNTFTNLNCGDRGVENPIELVTDDNGAVGAPNVNTPPVFNGGGGGANAGGGGQAAPPTTVANGG